jgi:3-isopropylmalate/(R)-2-methylmalate dehydratase small subunit
VDVLARTFYRNCFEVGLPALEVPGIGEIATTGATLSVDLTAGVVTDTATGRAREGRAADAFLVEMVEAGGLIALAAKRADLFG